MNKEVALKLLPNVNDPLVREAYEQYALYRIAKLKDQFLNARDYEEVQLLKGAIRELERFTTLRDEVLQHKG